MAAHAYLGPSAASRWLTCTLSPSLEAKVPHKSSVYADEGTLGHSIIELLIRYKLSLILEKAFKQQLKEYEAHELFTESLYDYCEQSAVFVVEEYYASQVITKDAQIILEERVDLSHLVPECFGTVDVQIIADGRLKVIDHKLGKGVLVFADENKQAMLYALGCLRGVSFLYDIKEVEIIINQPRVDNISRWVISTTELLAWGENYVRPRAKLAFEGKGDLIAGDHCRFCKVRANCRANYELQLEITKYDFKDPLLLTPEEISDVLMRSKNVESWLEAVEIYALEKATAEGVRWPGFKLVEGKTNRVYSSEVEVVKTLTTKGMEEDKLYTKKLLGLTAMQKLLGTTDFNSLVGPWLVKPKGNPTLVPESDKREELKSIETVRDDFKDLTNE